MIVYDFVKTTLDWCFVIYVYTETKSNEWSNKIREVHGFKRYSWAVTKKNWKKLNYKRTKHERCHFFSVFSLWQIDKGNMYQEWSTLTSSPPAALWLIKHHCSYVKALITEALLVTYILTLRPRQNTKQIDLSKIS